MEEHKMMGLVGFNWRVGGVNRKMAKNYTVGSFSICVSILIIIIIFIYCNWVVTRWQWLFYM